MLNFKTKCFMGIRYKLVQRKDFSKGALEDAKLYYPQLLNNGNISFDEVCEAVAEQTALTRADVKACLDRLAYIISTNLKAGRSVNLGDLGSFRVALSSSGASTPEEYDASTMMRPMKVVYTAGKSIQEIRSKATFDRIKTEETGG